jgi:hypothetical protein
MRLQILEDAKERPDLFAWAGSINANELYAWRQATGVRLHPELEFLLMNTGGGDIFESETILSPLGGHPTGDNAVEANQFHRQRGMSPDYWLFHVGIVLSAVDQSDGHIVTLSNDYTVQNNYESLEQWYVALLRDEYAERYGLTPLSDQNFDP